jgi:hypothetical protein
MLAGCGVSLEDRAAFQAGLASGGGYAAKGYMPGPVPGYSGPSVFRPVRTVAPSPVIYHGGAVMQPGCTYGSNGSSVFETC